MTGQEFSGIIRNVNSNSEFSRKQLIEAVTNEVSSLEQNQIWDYCRDVAKSIFQNCAYETSEEGIRTVCEHAIKLVYLTYDTYILKNAQVDGANVMEAQRQKPSQKGLELDDIASTIVSKRVPYSIAEERERKISELVAKIREEEEPLKEYGAMLEEVERLAYACSKGNYKATLASIPSEIEKINAQIREYKGREQQYLKGGNEQELGSLRIELTSAETRLEELVKMQKALGSEDRRRRYREELEKEMGDYKERLNALNASISNLEKQLDVLNTAEHQVSIREFRNRAEYGTESFRIKDGGSLFDRIYGETLKAYLEGMKQEPLVEPEAQSGIDASSLAMILHSIRPTVVVSSQMVDEQTKRLLPGELTESYVRELIGRIDNPIERTNLLILLKSRGHNEPKLIQTLQKHKLL